MDSSDEIPVLLLGDAGVGKSTFLSRLMNPHRASDPAAVTLRDMDQPFIFDVRLSGDSHRLAFFDTASPTHYTTLQPAVIVLCYSIAAPESLTAMKPTWGPVVDGHFNQDETVPVIVLGLQRDVRERGDYDGSVKRMVGEGEGGDGEVLVGRTFVYPQEGLRVAQEMRCDRYCECSALTGELCREVFEDIITTAAKTSTGHAAGRSQDATCAIM